MKIPSAMQDGAGSLTTLPFISAKSTPDSCVPDDIPSGSVQLPHGETIKKSDVDRGGYRGQGLLKFAVAAPDSSSHEVSTEHYFITTIFRISVNSPVTIR